MISPQTSFGCSAEKRSAFTLIELLVVMAILALLVTLTGPALVAVFQGSALTQAGQTVQDQLTYYRQYAVANNVTVEVRFYTFTDPGIPNDTGHYRALQAFALASPTLTSGTFAYTKTPISKAIKLPPSIIMDSGAGGGGASSLSGLLYYANVGFPSANLGSSSSGLQTPGAADPPIFNVGNSYKYLAYQISPDGSTNLPYSASGMSTSSFYITLHALSNGDGLASAPKNFFTVQVDPIDGHIYFYRP